MALNDLSLRLAGLGRREDALAGSKQAVDTYRELAAAHPDAFRPGLATALTRFGVQLTELLPALPEPEMLADLGAVATHKRSFPLHRARWPAYSAGSAMFSGARSAR